MVSIFKVRFVFTDRDGLEIDPHRDIWMVYLARQIKALIHFQELLDGQTSTLRAPALRERLRACFPEDHEVHTHQAALAEWNPSTFDWPSGQSFKVTLRQTGMHSILPQGIYLRFHFKTGSLLTKSTQMTLRARRWTTSVFSSNGHLKQQMQCDAPFDGLEMSRS